MGKNHRLEQKEMRIVIRAGGVGTRLWPWSRSDCPKQFLPMFDGRSCVQMAYDRFTRSGLASADDVYVSVTRAHERIARDQLPRLGADHFIVEPAKMDTAAAIGLETIVVAGEDSDVIIASLGSDHYVAGPDEFVRALRAAERFLTANPERLLAIACRPSRVETNYGHVKMGDALGEFGGMAVHAVDEFAEKPDLETARRYTESGQYLWNANFFVWRAGTLIEQFREFEPEMHATLMEILSARGTDWFPEVLEEKYPILKRIAIDYAVLEPAAARGRLAVVPVAMGWSDIGSWATLTDAFPPDEDGNLLIGPVLARDTKDSTIYVANPSRKLIAAIGVEGLAVVDTEDALLICPKELSGRVKELVEELKRSTEHNKLT